MISEEDVTMTRSILLVTDAYPPEIRSSSILMQELALRLVEAGLAVSVLTTFPRYNLSPAARSRYSTIRGNVVADENGIQVHRVPTLPIHHVGPLRKGIGQLALVPTLLAYALRLPRPDIVLVYSPPLPLGLLAGLLGRLRGSHVVVNVQDLFPQNAIDLGVLRGRLAVAFWKWIEALTYRWATVVACHSAGNRQVLQRHPQLSADKVIEVPNWIDFDLFRNTTPDPSFRALLDIPSKSIVVLFGGVLGFAQDIPTIVEAARYLPSDSPVAILVVGDGVFRSLVETAASDVPSLYYHPFVDPDVYRRWLVAADVGLVTLGEKMKTPVVPSKLLNFMAAAKPVVAALNPESDGLPILHEAQCGLAVPPSRPQALAQALLDLAALPATKRHRMGVQGQRYAMDHFSIDKCIARYLSIFERLGK